MGAGIAVVLCALGALAPFERDGRWGYKDGAGKVVIPARYQMAQEFSKEGIAAVADEKGWMYIDARGRTLLRPLILDNGPDYFSEGLARFVHDGKVGFFDRRGRVVIPPRFDFAFPFSEGRAVVCQRCSEKQEGEHRAVRGGRWGFIDSKGALAVPLRYDEAGPFENGRARVRLGGRWVSIDKTGASAPVQ